jgi:hypothetical protein
MATGTIQLRIVLSNRKAIRALAYITQHLREEASDRPWDTEARRLASAALYALKHLKPISEREYKER